MRSIIHRIPIPIIILSKRRITQSKDGKFQMNQNSKMHTVIFSLHRRRGKRQSLPISDFLYR